MLDRVTTDSKPAHSTAFRRKAPVRGGFNLHCATSSPKIRLAPTGAHFETVGKFPLDVGGASQNFLDGSHHLCSAGGVVTIASKS
jgi:hypothetical protein